MSLRTQAETDLGFILESDTQGFRWPITVTSPSGAVLGDDEDLYGFSDDIAQLIDPETGVLVSGRIATVALRISTLLSFFADLPRYISSSTSKPWIVTFNDINGVSHTFKVKQADQDRALGLLICILEVYTP